MSSRRAFLGGAATLAVAGCSGTADVLGLRHSVRIAVSWGGTELRAFRSVLDGLGIREYGVEVVPLGDDISTAFGPRSPRRPDIVMLPQPGLVRAKVDELAPLPDDLADRAHTELWEDLLVHEGTTYGLPFKVAHKSAVWYRPSVFREHGVVPPTQWSQWLVLNHKLSLAGVPPLALAAGDGWVLTDFFENVLLGSSPAAYQALAVAQHPLPSADPGVAAALRLLGAMWAAPGALAGGVDRCLVQQFPDAVVEVFGHRRAAMVVATDFAESVVRDLAEDPSDVGVFPFPAMAPGARRPVVVGGDVAVLPAPATDEARDLVLRLAAPDAVDPWVKAGGFLADGRVGGYSPELTRLAVQLFAASNQRAFDLSDRLGPLGGSEGLWRVLQDFLVAIGGRGVNRVASAARRAMDELSEVEG